MSKSAWGVGVPIAIVVLGLLIWALLAGMPFGRDRDSVTRRDPAAMETIGEGAAPAGSNGRELVVPDDEEALGTTTTATTTATSTMPPPATATRTAGAPRATTPTSTPMSTPSSTPARAAAPARQSAAVPAAVPARREPEPDERRTPQGEITQSQAAATLRGYIAGRAELGVSGDCLEVSTVEYKNRGYTMNAADRCDEKSLGRWRVDSLTREIFRQQSDGRYVRP